jgi:hypothetical protein
VEQSTYEFLLLGLGRDCHGLQVVGLQVVVDLQVVDLQVVDLQVVDLQVVDLLVVFLFWPSQATLTLHFAHGHQLVLMLVRQQPNLLWRILNKPIIAVNYRMISRKCTISAIVSSFIPPFNLAI